MSVEEKKESFLRRSKMPKVLRRFFRVLWQQPVYTAVNLIFLLAVPVLIYIDANELRTSTDPMPQFFRDTISGILILMIGIPLGFQAEHIITALRQEREKHDLLNLILDNLILNRDRLSNIAEATRNRKFSTFLLDTGLLESCNQMLTNLLGPTELRTTLNVTNFFMISINRQMDTLLRLIGSQLSEAFFKCVEVDIEKFDEILADAEKELRSEIELY